MQFINAASTPSLKVQIGGKVWYPSFAPGQKTSAGAFPSVDWNLAVTASSEDTKVKTRKKVGSGDSYTTVFIGDFKKVVEEGDGAAKKESVRGTVLFLDNAMTPGKAGHRVRIVNGLVDMPVTASSDAGESKTIAYAEVAEFSDLSASTRMRVQVGGRAIPLSFVFVPPERGCTVAFYRIDDKVKYAVSNEVILNSDGTIPSASAEEVEAALKAASESEL